MKRLLILSLLLAGVLLQNLTMAVGQTSATLYPTIDGYADSKYPKMMYGARTTFLYVGNSHDREQDIWGSERIYIRFNLTEISKDHVILQATLRLWQYYAPDSNQTYEAHRVLSNWKEDELSWVNQPSSSPAVTSAAIAPTQTEVAVEWNITSDVKAWYSGEAPNYGTMIKVAKEEQVSGASSGFWSREYPVASHEEWKPRLLVTYEGKPGSIYTVSIDVAGFPAPLTTDVAVDGKFLKTVSQGGDISVVFDLGTTHTINASGIVSGTADTRYVCDVCQLEVSNSSQRTFTYVPEYLVNVTTEPNALFETAQSGWYKSGTVLPLSRTGEDVMQTSEGARLVFDGWYMNGQKMIGEPGTIVVDGSSAIEGRYRTEYFVNITSPSGVTNGSGWYAANSIASFSVDPTTVPAPGLLGVLGLRRVFSGWVGSENFVGVPNQDHGSILAKQPTTIEATWRDDWNMLLSSLAVLVVSVAIVCYATFVWSRRRRSQPLAKK